MCLPQKASEYFFQKVATGIGCLLCLNFGILFGITSSHMLLYQSSYSPLIRLIDTEAASYLGAYIYFGGIIGSLFFGYASEKIGPKSSLLLCGLFQIGCWFCILFAYNINHIYWSRISGGLAAGGAFALLPIYIKDIAQEKHQQSLQQLIDAFKNIGIFLGFLLAHRDYYEYLQIIGLCSTFVFTMFFPFMPESPHFYARSGDIPLMEKSLRWLRGIRSLEDRSKPEFLKEISEIIDQANLKENLNQQNQTNFKSQIIVNIVLLMVSQLCGIFLILNYVETIFGNLGFSLSSQAGLILAGAQLIGSFINVLLLGKLKQKNLIAATSIISGILLIILATLMTFNKEVINLNTEQISWIAIGISATFMFIANIGFYSLTLVGVVNISSKKIRERTIYLSMSLMWLLAMLMIKFYHDLNDAIGFLGLLWIFGGTCVFNFFFTIWCVREYHHKSTSEANGNGS